MHSQVLCVFSVILEYVLPLFIKTTHVSHIMQTSVRHSAFVKVKTSQDQWLKRVMYRVMYQTKIHRGGVKKQLQVPLKSKSQSRFDEKKTENKKTINKQRKGVLRRMCSSVSHFAANMHAFTYYKEKYIQAHIHTHIYTRTCGHLGFHSFLFFLVFFHFSAIDRKSGTK